jgi:hypothetical protein
MDIVKYEVLKAVNMSMLFLVVTPRELYVGTVVCCAIEHDCHIPRVDFVIKGCDSSVREGHTGRRDRWQGL